VHGHIGSGEEHCGGGEEGHSYHFSKSDLIVKDFVLIFGVDEYKSFSMDVLCDLTLVVLIRLF
jgi:hypothetical protein